MRFFKSLKLWKSSTLLSFAIIGFVASIVGIAGVSFADFTTITTKTPFEGFFASRAERLGTTVLTCVLLVAVIVLVKLIITRTGVTINVNGIPVRIKQGDLFKGNGLKVIPFNEYFDTTVDDRVISHASLNGKFIDSHVTDANQLRQAIEQDDENSMRAKCSKRGGRFVYPLGRVIKYQGYLLLALTHFDDQNRAHFTKKEYVQGLMTMWQEISRVYAGKPICLPLLGSGIARFDDAPNKSWPDLLECMLYTLKISGENINAPITILLTRDAMQKINLYEMKGVL